MNYLILEHGIQNNYKLYYKKINILFLLFLTQTIRIYFKKGQYTIYISINKNKHV